MTNKAERNISDFYNSVGWEAEQGVTEDARRWEDLREHSRKYVSDCRLRVLRHIPQSGDKLLDMASGPIQYPEYLEYSKNFRKRYCVDLSGPALQVAKSRIGDHGVFLHGSFFDLPLEDNTFDCAVSLHTIYHIDQERQEEAVRKLLRVTKPGQPVIVVYSNPRTFVGSFSALLKKAKSLLGAATTAPDDIYFYVHPIGWWRRFEDCASVKILPWRSFGANVQKKLIPDNRFGSWMLDRLFRLEERFPDFFVNHFLYPMVILTKKKS